MPIRQTMFALSAACCLALGAAAQARPPGGPGGGHDPLVILHAVQLTAAQKQQMHQILKAAHTQEAPVAAQLRALDQQIEATLFGTASVTQAQLAPLEQRQAGLREQLETSRLQTALAIRNLLTSAQLAKAASVQSQLAALHQQEHALLAAGGQPEGDAPPE